MKLQDRFGSRSQLLKELSDLRLRLAEIEAPDSHRLSRGEAEMRAIVDALPDLVIRAHRDGTFLDVKSPSQDVLARPADEIVGRNIRDTGLPERVIAIHLWNMEAALSTGSVQAFEYPLEVAKGVREFEGRAVACSQDEVLLVIRDITESKRASEKLRRLEEHVRQAERSESVGRLAAGVAHNLNNLLAPVLAYTELLLDRDLPAGDQQERLRAIHKAAQDASELTQQLLAVASEQPHEVSRIDLGQLVADYERILRGALRKGVDLEIRCRPDAFEIEADSSRIQQILLNLVLNAGDAIRGQGRVVIETRVVELDDRHPELRPGHYGALRVSDTGSGIDPSIRDRIFDPFFTTKGQGKGTGLGLASVRGIVRQHGGAVRVESTLGEGSVFEVLLPLCDGAGDVAEASSEVAGEPERQVTVLVVEDDETVNFVVCRMLRDHGYLVLTATGAEECLHLVQRHSGPIDLLLADVVMRGLSGRELYERLRSSLPGLKVLYMSGHTGGTLEQHGIDRDTMQLVLKPFSVARLLAEVKGVLESG